MPMLDDYQWVLDIYQENEKKTQAWKNKTLLPLTNIVQKKRQKHVSDLLSEHVSDREHRFFHNTQL